MGPYRRRVQKLDPVLDPVARDGQCLETAKAPNTRAFLESGRQDLNLRPPGPQPGALPDCATPRGASSLRQPRRQAGDENRTRALSLEGSRAAVTPRPRVRGDHSLGGRAVPRCTFRTWLSR